MKKYFLDLINTFEDYLAPSLEWKIQVANRLCKDAAEEKEKRSIEGLKQGLSGLEL